METSPNVLVQTNAENVLTYEQNYSVEFVPATKAQQVEFNRLVDLITQKRKELQPEATDIGVSSPALPVIHEPEVFLKTPLTSHQTTLINDRETSKVADYCLEVQAKLAQVPIVESNERMVHLPSVYADAQIDASFSAAPFHAACGEWAGQPREFWTRENFANRLILMSKILGAAGLYLHFEDAFRPVGVQEGLFKRRVSWTRRDHPEWTEDQIIAEAQSKTAVKPRLASHKGGAAVDARLIDKTTGRLLDYGHNYPDGGALVFPRTPFVTAEQWRNRQLFQVAAFLSDLTLYVGEDWHVSFGDNLASLDSNGRVQPDYIAQYGPIKQFDHATGAIIEAYDPEEMNQIFDY